MKYMFLIIIILSGCEIPQKKELQEISTSDKTIPIQYEKYMLKEFHQVMGESKSDFYIELVYSQSWAPNQVLRIEESNGALVLNSVSFRNDTEAWLNNLSPEVISKHEMKIPQNKYFQIKDSLIKRINNYELMDAKINGNRAEDGYSILLKIKIDNKSKSIWRWVVHKSPLELDENITRFCKYIMDLQFIGIGWNERHTPQ